MKFGKRGIRLITAIPLSIFLLSLVSGFSTLRLAFTYSPSIVSEAGINIALWVLLVSSMALVVGIVLSLAIVRPINRIVKQAAAVLPEEDGMLPSKDKGGNEIESLVYVFERLVNSLDKRTMSTERPRIELVRQKIHRVEYLANIGAFSLGLVHEIKDPLGYLQGLVELIDKDLGDEDRKKQYVNTIIRGIERLNKLANDLLSIARIDQMKLEQINIEEALKEAIDISAYKYSWKKVRIQQNYDKDSQEVYGSHEKLIQVFSNILTNAIEATPEGGEITISTESMNSSVFIHIKNTGSYILPEDKEKLFQPFFTKKEAGIGLGLFIAKQIVVAHSGTISAESDPEKGTVFSVELQKSLILQE